jgi:hypothetical protein
MFRITFSLILAVVLCQQALAGATYEVTSKVGDQVVKYKVKFGGGFMFEQMTAFDPASKKFVYLTWKRNEAKPEPAAVIWDHRTGKKIELYKFPDAEHPLPVIASIEEMKFCPMTGVQTFSSKLIMEYD